MSDRCPDCEYLSNDRSDLYDLDHDIWYITAFNMTTRYVSPSGCGTRIPIWMNGTIPMIAEGVVSRTACEATFESLCASSYSIKVKRCDSSNNVYCLDNLPSSVQQRYCFDFDPTLLTPTTSNTPYTTRSTETPSKAPSTVGSTTTSKASSSIPSTTRSNAPSMIVSTTTRSLSTSSITQTTETFSRLSLSTEAMPVTYMTRYEENGIQIWVIGVIVGLIAVIAILGAVLLYMKRQVFKKKEDNEYDVPEKKNVSYIESNDYMTLDLPPKEAISDQNEVRYVYIQDICK
ncbi:hypothetical protein ACJMK2_019132 [Sinanodonta woodiana]|uniref:UMOD/GP2/OIT3-like D8C domain-containing protein n=1 Tax=Sinanodonta woodiana TaxID=1069815 RepID=A0ABD3UFF5_SINWO